MFGKDVILLNEIYNQKIVKEMNLGPNGDNQDITPTPNNISKIQMPPEKECGCEDEETGHCPWAVKGCDCSECEECKANQKSEDCEACQGGEGAMPDDSDSNSTMSRQLLFRIFKLSAMLHKLLENKGDVEAWVLSKITNAHDQLDSVFGYEDYNNAREQMSAMGMGLEENNEEELFKAISNGGNQLLTRLKTVLKKESKETLEKVLLETIILLEGRTKK